MKRKTNRFSAYQQSMFNKYEIDESYLQTGKQRRACLELLEKIDKSQVVNEKTTIEKLTEAFQGSALHKKIASCMTIAMLLTVLQSTPAMAMASSDYQSTTRITNTVDLMEDNDVIFDEDSYLDYNRTVIGQMVKVTSLHLESIRVKSNPYEPMVENGVLIDGDSDVAYWQKQESRTLTVIDTSLIDWKIIRDAVKEGEILLLEDGENPLDAILAKLENWAKSIA